MFHDKVRVALEDRHDVYLLRPYGADDPVFEPWEGDPVALLDSAVRDGLLPVLLATFGDPGPRPTEREGRDALAAQIHHGRLVARGVLRPVIALHARRDKPDTESTEVDQDPDAPTHLLSILSDVPQRVKVGRTVDVVASGAPSGTYTWTLVSGPGTLTAGIHSATVTVRVTAGGTITLRVRHVWAGDVKEATATVEGFVYVWRWDPPHTTDRQQFVNLPAAWDPHNGRTVELLGHVEPREPGETVNFTLVPDPGNEPDTPAGTLSTATATTGERGEARVTLTLPPYGGARFKVGGATVTTPTATDSGVITVWRKVYYQVTDMASSPAPEELPLAAPADMISALQGAFEPVFFKLEPSVVSHAVTPYQAHLTADQRTALENNLRPAARDARSPFKMNIVMVDRADIVAETEWTSAATTATVFVPQWFRRWPYEATVVYAQYQTAAHTWADLVNVREIAHPSDTTQLSVQGTIPGFTAPGPVNVRIKYRWQRGSAGGWGGTTGTLFMCLGNDRRRNRATPTGAQLQQALTHEIGHALGLVPTTASWLDPDPRDAVYSLRHCGYKDTATPPQPRCVMWFMLGGSGARLRFCHSDRPNDCSHFLYRTDYSALHWI